MSRKKEELIEALSCKVSQDREAAAEALAVFKDEDVTRALYKALDHWDRTTRRQAAISLLNIVGKDVIPTLITKAEKRELPLGFTIDQISRYKTPEVKAFLEGCSANPAWNVSSKADRALETTFGIKKQFIYEPKEEEVEGEEEEEEVEEKEEEAPSFLKELSELSNLDHTLLGIGIGKWNSIDKEYTSFTIKKKSGGSREIRAPKPWLKKIQRGIYLGLLKDIELHECCHGFRRGHSTVKNAEPHVGKKMVINQ